MGDIADYINEMGEQACYEHECECPDGSPDCARNAYSGAPKFTPTRTHWKKGIRPCDMSDEHLMNAIHYIEVNKSFVLTWGGLLYEAGRRGLVPQVPEAQR